MRRAIICAIAVTAATLAACSSALGSSGFKVAPGANTPALDTWANVPGVQHLHYAAGPYTVTPGANLILIDHNKLPKPDVDGYMVRFAPNLHYALPNGTCCGAVPRVDVIHLHHGVWLTNGKAGAGEGNGYIGGFYPFVAVGEEKTVTDFPRGYGYPVGGNDVWLLNYMIHNLTAKTAKVWITYDIDFIPASSPAAAGMTAVHPIWMDVRDHNIYPVFDVKRYSGRNGKFTYPDMAKNPYAGQAPLNMFTVDHAGTLIGTAGHLHPGGLYDELDDIRAGASPSGGAISGPVPNSVRLFRSVAQYWDKRGPISWDMALTATPGDWRVAVKSGDQLRISVTYDTTRASWYESMGIMVVWEAWNDNTGTDPFSHKLDQNGAVTHGHLRENNHHGGNMPLSVGNRKGANVPINVSLKSSRDCFTHNVAIAGFSYNPGDFTATGRQRCIPTIRKGQSLTFTNDDAYAGGTFDVFTPDKLYLISIFHSVTACQYPCGLNTGISYPLANGGGNFDSGQLGAGTPAVGKLSWSTPVGLKPGTYTFYCRVHPFMRGVFRVIG